MNRKEFYESLSEETKAKIKACKNEQEMLAVLKEEHIELDPELLDGVAGGNQNDPPGGCDHKCEDHKSCI